MSEKRVREALAASSRRTALGRIRPRRSARSRRDPESASPELTALLERHRPVLQYDSLESFRADSVATIANLVSGRRCNTLHRAGGTLIASAAPSRRGGAARPRLPTRALLPGRSGGATRRLPGRVRWFTRRRRAGDAAAGAAARTSSTGTLATTPRSGSGSSTGSSTTTTTRACSASGWHEGDWEMIQMRLGADGEPQELTYAQHAGGERAGWEEVERDGEAPVLYVARGSHAARFRPGSLPRPGRPRPQRRAGATVAAAAGDDRRRRAGLGAVAGAVGVDPAARVL